MNEASGNSSPFSGPLVGILIAVSLFGLMAVLVLSAWSPELRDKNRAGDHPYSTSAIGYGGLVRLLETRGDPVQVSRIGRQLEVYTGALKVVTLSPYGMDERLDELDLRGQALVVLPKWQGFMDIGNPKWQGSVAMTSEGEVERALDKVWSGAEVWRVRAPATIRTPFGEYRPGFGDDFQVIRSDTLEPVISTPAGMLVAKLVSEDIYILSDPDLFNTVGVSQPARAHLALSLLDWLRYDDTQTPVVFDASLHGFEQAQSIFQMVFDIPFLGATLVAFCVFLMFGWAGAVRFGAPERQRRAIALGKQALTDSTAGLITMTGREPRLAPGYLLLTRRAAAKAIAAPKTLSEDELTDLFDRMTPKDETPFTDLAEGTANPAASREDLMTKARRLFQWRKEMTHGR